MNYLTFSEYDEMKPGAMDEPTFDKYYNKACAVLDHVTGFFYHFNSLENDVVFRKTQFKKALAAQIEYFKSINMTTFNDVSNQPQSFTIGRTTVTNRSGRTKDESNDLKPIVAVDVYVHLDGTGLLYRGVGV